MRIVYLEYLQSVCFYVNYKSAQVLLNCLPTRLLPESLSISLYSSNSNQLLHVVSTLPSKTHTPQDDFATLLVLFHYLEVMMREERRDRHRDDTDAVCVRQLLR
jgi:phytoene dehydrogenase-like protein